MLLTFTWSVVIKVPDTFDSLDEKQYRAALTDAWLNVQQGDGELTDFTTENN